MRWEVTAYLPSGEELSWRGEASDAGDANIQASRRVTIPEQWQGYTLRWKTRKLDAGDRE